MLHRAMRCMLAVLPCLTGGAAAQSSIITNGDFESGNTGFSSDYSYSSGGNCCEGQYTVRANGSTFNGSFVNPPPSAPGSVLMMVVNGSTAPNQRIWYQTVPVTGGTTYALVLRGCTAVAGGPAILQWQIDGSLIGASFSLPTTTAAWIDVPVLWTAPPGATSAVVAVRNLNTSSFPNDFYIDGLSMIPEPQCDSIDFNGDGLFPDTQDIADFLTVFAGGPCSNDPNCGDIDYNNDGLFPDTLDIQSLLSIFAGGTCL
ncbi:MAG TPA: hypothetical protein VHN77_01960 [Phycisphaerales bacterium]|nr:hypothetical protein [Phycisphaerales bacterium]